MGQWGAGSKQTFTIDCDGNILSDAGLSTSVMTTGLESKCKHLFDQAASFYMNILSELEFSCAWLSKDGKLYAQHYRADGSYYSLLTATRSSEATCSEPVYPANEGGSTAIDASLNLPTVDWSALPGASNPWAVSNVGVASPSITADDSWWRAFESGNSTTDDTRSVWHGRMLRSISEAPFKSDQNVANRVIALPSAVLSSATPRRLGGCVSESTKHKRQLMAALHAHATIRDGMYKLLLRLQRRRDDKQRGSTQPEAWETKAGQIISPHLLDENLIDARVDVAQQANSLQLSFGWGDVLRDWGDVLTATKRNQGKPSALPEEEDGSWLMRKVTVKVFFRKPAECDMDDDNRGIAAATVEYYTVHQVGEAGFCRGGSSSLFETIVVVAEDFANPKPHLLAVCDGCSTLDVEKVRHSGHIEHSTDVWHINKPWTPRTSSKMAECPFSTCHNAQCSRSGQNCYARSPRTTAELQPPRSSISTILSYCLDEQEPGQQQKHRMLRGQRTRDRRRLTPLAFAPGSAVLRYRRRGLLLASLIFGNFKYLKPEILEACEMFVAKKFMKLKRRDCEKQLRWIDGAFAQCCINADGEMRDKCEDTCFSDKFKRALENQGQKLSAKVPIFWRGSRAKFTALASSGSATSESNYIALEGTIWGAILDSVQNDPIWKGKNGQWLKHHTEWPVVKGHIGPEKDRSRGIDGTWKVWDAMSASLALLAKPSSMLVPIIFGESAPSIVTPEFHDRMKLMAKKAASTTIGKVGSPASKSPPSRKYNYYGVGVKEEMVKVIKSSSNEYIAIDAYGQRECVTEHEARKKSGYGYDPQVCTKPWAGGEWTCEQELKKWAELWTGANVIEYQILGIEVAYALDGKVMRITNARKKQKYFTCVRGGDDLTVADINSKFQKLGTNASNLPPGWPMGNSLINEPVTTYTSDYLGRVRNRFYKLTMEASRLRTEVII
jgi:hypothetical protein